MISDFMKGTCSDLKFRYIEGGYIEVDGDVSYYDLNKSIYKNKVAAVSQWKDLIYKNASKYRIAPAIVAGFMARESGGNKDAISPAGAIGLMQIMPGTGIGWGKEFLGRIIEVSELFNPEINIELGTAGIAKYMKNTGGNIVNSAASYNAGKPRCGVFCLRDKDTKEVIRCCSPSRWNLSTDCGYIDGVINWTNTMIKSGYSGNLIKFTETPAWATILLLAGMTATGAVVGFGAKKGWFSSSKEAKSWRS
jgi:hypothetical protein